MTPEIEAAIDRLTFRIQECVTASDLCRQATDAANDARTKADNADREMKFAQLDLDRLIAKNADIDVFDLTPKETTP